jgi:hypothetical protein
MTWTCGHVWTAATTADPVGNTPEEFRAFLQENMTNLMAIAHDSNIKLN